MVCKAEVGKQTAVYKRLICQYLATAVLYHVKIKTTRTLEGSQHVQQSLSRWVVSRPVHMRLKENVVNVKLNRLN